MPSATGWTPRPERSIRPLNLLPTPAQGARNELPTRSLNLIVPLQIPNRRITVLIRQVVKRPVIADRSLFRSIPLRTPSADKPGILVSIPGSLILWPLRLLLLWSRALVRHRH